MARLVLLNPKPSPPPPPSMLLRRIFTSLPQNPNFPTKIRFPTKPISQNPIFRPLSSPINTIHTKRPPIPPIPPITVDKADLFRGLETALGSPFTSTPLSPSPTPLVVVISGPSGVGKDAVIKNLRARRAEIHFVVTATTRAMRESEVEGKDYYFVSKSEFLEMVEKDELLEYAVVYGEYKGIPRRQIREFLSEGRDVVLRVDVQGAATLRRVLGDSAVFVFLAAESEAALVERLVGRKTETTEALLVRVATAREEVKYVDRFDYVVVNAEGRLEEAVGLVESIIDAEKARVRQRKARI